MRARTANRGILLSLVVLPLAATVAACEPTLTAAPDRPEAREAQLSSIFTPAAVRITVSCSQDPRLRAVTATVRFAGTSEPVLLTCFYRDLGSPAATAVVPGAARSWKIRVDLFDVFEDFGWCVFQGTNVPSGPLRCTNGNATIPGGGSADRDERFLHAGATVTLSPARSTGGGG